MRKTDAGPEGAYRPDVRDRYKTHHDTYVYRYPSLSELNGFESLDSDFG